MQYVLFHIESTLIVGRYKTEGAAKAAATRLSKLPESDKRRIVLEDHSVMTIEEFQAIEKQEVRHGIVHCEGKEYTVGVNTPWTSGPWSETYWCQ